VVHTGQHAQHRGGSEETRLAQLLGGRHGQRVLMTTWWRRRPARQRVGNPRERPAGTCRCALGSRRAAGRQQGRRWSIGTGQGETGQTVGGSGCTTGRRQSGMTRSDLGSSPHPLGAVG
jgi:hypothetical protein